MFDLFRSREKSVRILLGALLLLVALSMLTYLVPNYGSGGGSADDTVVAVVGGTPITLLEVQRAIQNTMRGRQIPPEMLGNLIPQLVENIVNDRALAYEAQRQGFQVSESEMRDAIQAMVPSLFQDGKFVGRETYAAMLAQQNLTIADFESEMRRGMMAGRLRAIAVQGIVVTPQEIEQEFRKRNEKTRIEYVKVAGDKYRGEIEPSEANLRALLQGNAGRYQVPEKKALAVLVADQAKLEATITPTDADLQRAYSQNKESFRVPERVKVRHILLKTMDKTNEEAKIKARAEDLLKQLKAGADFAKLATANSEDPGSAKNGGELPEWVSRGQMVAEFEKAAFTQKPGELSDLVKTQYGYHIVQVLKKEDAHLRSFDEVKGELTGQWKKQRVADMMEQAANRAQSALAKDPMHPEKVAADLNLQLLRVPSVTAGEPLPELGSNKDLDEALATLKKNEVSQPIALPGNKVVIAEVTDVAPARPMTFEEARAGLRGQWIGDKLQEVLVQKANELVAKAKANGGDLKAAAKSMGLDAKTSDDYNRQGAVEGVGSASYLADTFVKPVGTIVGPLPVTDGRLVAKVLAHIEPNLAELATQSSSLRDEIKSKKSRDRATLFESGLREALIKEGKIKIHQNVINRLMTNYRG